MTDTNDPTTSPDAPAGASGEVRAKRRYFSAAENSAFCARPNGARKAN